jgi:predicted NACHT family NTPase
MTKIQATVSVALARDARSDANITLDLSLPRAIFVTGKRGSGKTTTLRAIAAATAEAGATVIAIDPIGALSIALNHKHLRECCKHYPKYIALFVASPPQPPPTSPPTPGSPSPISPSPNPAASPSPASSANP